jgi:hypothetical protein
MWRRLAQASSLRARRAVKPRIGCVPVNPRIPGEKLLDRRRGRLPPPVPCVSATPFFTSLGIVGCHLVALLACISAAYGNQAHPRDR